MKVRYHLFCILIGSLHFPYLSQAITRLNTSMVLDDTSSPRPLQSVQNRCNRSYSNKADEVAGFCKTMRIEAMVQRSWIASMVVPGLGQIYHKDYWKVPCFYLGFALVCSRIYTEHEEMHTHKRTLLLASKEQPIPTFTKKRIKECKRTRNLFIIIASAWYLLNIFDAYAGAHNQVVNFKDDIVTEDTPNQKAIVQPTHLRP